MADETGEIDAWLYSALSTDATLNPLIGNRVYPDLAPEGTAFPYVVYSVPNGTDMNSIGMQRNTTTVSYVVSVYGRNDGFADLQTITSRIDTIIQGSRHIGVAVNWKVARRSPWTRLTEFKSDTRYPRLFATFGVTAQPVY